MIEVRKLPAGADSSLRATIPEFNMLNRNGESSLA